MMKWMLSALLATFLGTGCVSDGTTDVLLSIDLVVATNNADSFTIAGVSTSFCPVKHGVLMEWEHFLKAKPGARPDH